ncbi:MAG: SDR family oxidoreductase [Alphaproteobacteria bacterium]|nr:SDR family oxidoreductase [Alphaproteobacteria bacterium]
MQSRGRVALITGAASGIGAALARRIAAPDIGLVLHSGGSTAESAARLQQVVQACEAAGAACVVSKGNLAEPGHGAAAVEAAGKLFGRLDRVVHAAGHVHKVKFGELTKAEFDRAIALMPGALLEILTAAMPLLARSPAGRVVAVSSFIARKIEQPTFAPASSVAKAALEALVRCFALQLAPTGTTVNAVAPGFTRKDAGRQGSLSPEGWAQAARRTPTGRLNETDEVAAAIEFLLSDGARQITGATLAVDGGLTLG